MYYPLFWLVVVVGLAALLLWPKRGLLWRWQRDEQAENRIQVEDVLKHLYTYEVDSRRATPASIAGRLQISENDAARLIQTMQEHGLVQWGDERLQLTPDGRAYALHIVRAHRLWERYLADQTGYDEKQWHAQAEQIEHELTPEEMARLADRLGNPLVDPHGDPIPTASGELLGGYGQSLTTVAPGQVARIVHLEDEPEAIYAQLVAEGFYPGMLVKVLAQSPQSVRVWADNDEHLLAPIVAAAIAVEEVQVSLPAAIVKATLVDLAPPARGACLTSRPAAAAPNDGVSSIWASCPEPLSRRNS